MERSEIVEKIKTACIGLIDNLDGRFYDSETKVEYFGVYNFQGKIFRVNISLKVDDVKRQTIEQLKDEITSQINKSILQ